MATLLFAKGISFIFLSLVFNNTSHRPIVFLGFLCGSLAINISYYIYTYRTSFEYFLTILMISQLWLGIKIKSKSLILLNLLGILSYLIHFTNRLFPNSLSWLYAMAIGGATFILLAILMTRLLPTEK